MAVLMMDFDWKKAKRSLPFRGQTTRQGSKKTSPCPHCNSPRYGYHGGRFKYCPSCGYDRAKEKEFDIIQSAIVRGNFDTLRMDSSRIAPCVEYYLRVYGEVK